MNTFYCDFHIHIGRSADRPVKMAAAPSLTLANVVQHARQRKGLDVITVIDGVCTHVLEEFKDGILTGRFAPLVDGGYQTEDGLTVFLGSEVEVSGPTGGAAHYGCWFGTVEAAGEFQKWLATVQKNVSLSSQRARTDGLTLQRETHQHGGIFVVHHAFTPHKGMYGNCVDHMEDMLEPRDVDGLELGLSADTDMADTLSELQDITFLSNSDAHSLPKIAREYNALALEHPSFEQVRKALHRSEGTGVVANYGLEPALGKYHLSTCAVCGSPWSRGATRCACGSHRLVRGVYDRLLEVRDLKQPVHPKHRPPYIHQIPLEFIPGLGPKGRERLFTVLGTEMNILHHASVAQIAAVVGDDLAKRIDDARSGRTIVIAGGGGTYGKIASGTIPSIDQG